jgi:hypothetical protein
MNPINQLIFSVDDHIKSGKISPSNVPLALLGEFQRDVSDFLKGSNRDVDLNEVVVSIEQGSLALVTGGLIAASTLWADLGRLQSPGSLSLIDPKRAKVIEKWQKEAKRNPNRHYFVKDPSAQVYFEIDSASDFRRIEDVWVHVEKYLHGTIVDMGGNTTPNVHLKLENGVTLPPIAATQELLARGEQNRLYRPALLHVIAEENLINGELRNYQLLAFENYQPSYDEMEFNMMVEKGTKAWADVPDANAWLETLRGNQA